MDVDLLSFNALEHRLILCVTIVIHSKVGYHILHVPMSKICCYTGTFANVFVAILLLYICVFTQ